jgi:haloacetate dehalogenase
VVCTDLRGYGASGAPASDETHLAYSKRKMATDQVEVMAALGFDTFAVAGHDRGGRVVHRMVLDHPKAVTRAAVLDIAPTRTMFEATDMGFALTNYHWFFLAPRNGRRPPSPHCETSSVSRRMVHQGTIRMVQNGSLL